MSDEPDWNAPQQGDQPRQNQQNLGPPAVLPPSQGDQWNLSRPPYQEYRGPVGGSTLSPTGALAPNIAAMLSYLLFGWIGGLIMYLTQKDREVRFHAAQSILTFGGLAILILLFNIVNAIAGSVLLALLSLLISLSSFGLWIFLSIQGYQLKHTKLPVIGDLAEQWAAK